jgi:hypothetical protein
MGEPQGERKGRAPFDPVAGVRALGTIQAEGLRAAGELIERMLRTEPDGAATSARSAADGYTALVDAWTDLLRRTVDGLAPAGPPGAVTVALDASDVAPPVRLAAGAGAAAVELWVRNDARAPAGPLALRCGPLCDAGGTPLKGAQVHFDPRELELPPRACRAVAVSVELAGAARPGTYRGTIQAEGAPALWVPVEVTVAPC